jgi:copper chaperone CopZ
LNKHLVLLALVVVAALSVAACGGGGSSAEGEITETIEKAATTSDPANCTERETLNFVEQNTQTEGKAAVKACEEEAEAGEEQAEGVEVSNVSVNGEKATAEVAFEGGSLGSQALEVGLVEEGSKWKLDQIEGFANYDGKALGESCEKSFEEEENSELSKEQASCISEGVAKLSQTEAEGIFFEGETEKLLELAQGCA